METFYPDYYSEFICTADNCPLTCCQEWKIYVDDITKEKWKTLTPPESAGGHKKNLNSFTEKKEGIIRECDILFTKIDKKRASEEVARLKENKI